MNKSEEHIANQSIAFVVFGVTGDLTRRKLIPALYQLNTEKSNIEKIDIIGFARREWGSRKMVNILKEGIETYARVKPVESEINNQLFEDAVYIQSSFENLEGYQELNRILEEKQYQKILFYLATPPNAYEVIIRNLAICRDYSANKKWMRIVVEKPFGSGLDSAKSLENTLHSCFEEEQIYRIDHYLGKETVQNILVFRFANGIFEPLWNKHYVDHVQITVAETVGVGNRAGYFDKAGVIRDMFANHLLQLISLTAMEAPYDFNELSVRDEKMKVLRSLRPMVGESALINTIRAQYQASSNHPGKSKDYLEEDRVEPNSTTETYLAAKIFIDNWRWANVPFYVRSGKMLPKRATEIAIHFKQVPLSLFNWRNLAGDAPNVLVLRLQPDEGIYLSFGAKQPGQTNQISPVAMEFCYEDAFGASPPEAYERLLLDVIQGDQTLFTRNDEVIEQWKFASEIIHAWEGSNIKTLPKYNTGTWGPAEAVQFIHKDHRIWKNPR